MEYITYQGRDKHGYPQGPEVVVETHTMTAEEVESALSRHLGTVQENKEVTYRRLRKVGGTEYVGPTAVFLLGESGVLRSHPHPETVKGIRVLADRVPPTDAEIYGPRGNWTAD